MFIVCNHVLQLFQDAEGTQNTRKHSHVRYGVWMISFLSLLWCHLNFLRFTCCVCCSYVLYVILTFCLWFFYSYVLSVMLTFCLLCLRFVCYSYVLSVILVFTCYYVFLVFWHFFIAYRLVSVSRYGAVLPQQSSSSAEKGSRFPPPKKKKKNLLLHQRQKKQQKKKNNKQLQLFQPIQPGTSKAKNFFSLKKGAPGKEEVDKGGKASKQTKKVVCTLFVLCVVTCTIIYVVEFLRLSVILTFCLLFLRFVCYVCYSYVCLIFLRFVCCSDVFSVVLTFCLLFLRFACVLTFCLLFWRFSTCYSHLLADQLTFYRIILRLIVHMEKFSNRRLILPFTV